MIFQTSKLLALILIICLQPCSPKDMNICEGLTSPHLTSTELTCCKRKPVMISKMEDLPAWTNCTKQRTNDNESFNLTMWRIYTCVLKNLLPKGQKTINLTEFANLRITNFTKKVRNQILDRIQEVGEQKNRKPWLSTNIKLSNFDYLDKLRSDYFTIEKNVCGDKTVVKVDMNKGQKWNKCQENEEIKHRGGSCCSNNSIPFRLSTTRNDYYKFNPTNCTTTLKRKLERMMKWNTSHEEEALSACKASCYLIEKNLLTVEQLFNVRVNDRIDSDAIVKDQIPVFASKSALRQNQDYVRATLNPIKIMEDVKQSELAQYINPTDLYGCILYDHVLYNSIFALQHHCGTYRYIM